MELAFVVWFWVETKGKTLEETDKVIDGGKHSRVPDIEDRCGRHAGRHGRLGSR